MQSPGAYCARKSPGRSAGAIRLAPRPCAALVVDAGTRATASEALVSEARARILQALLDGPRPWYCRAWLFARRCCTIRIALPIEIASPERVTRPPFVSCSLRTEVPFELPRFLDGQRAAGLDVQAGVEVGGQLVGDVDVAGLRRGRCSRRRRRAGDASRTAGGPMTVR